MNKIHFGMKTFIDPYLQRNAYIQPEIEALLEDSAIKPFLSDRNTDGLTLRFNHYGYPKAGYNFGYPGFIRTSVVNTADVDKTHHVYHEDAKDYLGEEIQEQFGHFNASTMAVRLQYAHARLSNAVERWRQQSF